MTPSTPASDVDLSDATVESLIASQFPELAPVKLAVLGEDWDGKTFEVGGRYVFQFPKRRDVASTLEIEVELLPQLAPNLPVAIPSINFIGRGSSLFPYSFIGYPKLPGVPARRLRRRGARIEELAVDLAALLSALHATPVASARACGVGTCSPAHDPATLRWRARELFETARRELPEETAQRGAAFLARETRMPEPYGGPPVLVHNDLSSEHILVDTVSGKISGVVDWGDAALGDPAIDLAGIYAWLGAPLLDAVLAHYQGPLDDGARARARWMGACLGIFALAHGVAIDDRERTASAVHTLSFAADDRVLPD